MARSTKKTITAAAIYTRLSQDRNGDSLGIERQRELCEKVAAEHGWPVAEVFVERNVSAYSGARRPAYQRLVAEVGEGRIDAVIAVDQDRLARRLGELNEFIELCADKRVPVVLLSGELDTTTADGVLRAQILGAVAQNESAKKSERIKRQRDQAAKHGTFTGGRRRYGFETDMTHRRDEVKIIRQVARRLIKGESLRSVTLDLNERGIPAAKGGRWRRTNLRNMMIGPHLAGLRVHHGEVVGDAEWKPILDTATHKKLCRVLNDPARKGRRGRPPGHLLSGLIRCGKCGGPAWHATVNGVGAYRCADKSHGGCNGMTINADPLEEIIEGVVLHRLDSKRVRKALHAKRPRTVDPDDDLATIEQDLEDLATDHGEGRLTRREWLAAKEPLERRRAAVLTETETITNTAALEPFANATDVETAWRQRTLDERRKILAHFINHITIKPATIGTNTFDPDRIDIDWKV